jgi:hypothetical protein
LTAAHLVRDGWRLGTATGLSTPAHVRVLDSFANADHLVGENQHARACVFFWYGAM